MITLQGIRYTTGRWCPLVELNLADSHFENLTGVYVIWQGNGSVIRVGQGVIRDRLSQHRQDQQIIAYPNLLVTWAKVSDYYLLDGVERYLANMFNPKIGDRFPNVDPIEVNLPR